MSGVSEHVSVLCYNLSVLFKLVRRNSRFFFHHGSALVLVVVSLHEYSNHRESPMATMWQCLCHVSGQ